MYLIQNHLKFQELNEHNFMRKTSLILLLLLLGYFLLIANSDQSLEGDEFRYLRYASDMVKGSYTDPNNPDLTNGPGYPIVLLPFVTLNIPLLVPKLLNGIFVFIGIVYFYQTLKFFVKQKYALIFSVILGIYPPLLRWMTVLYSEAFSFMLICGIIYYFCLLNQRKKHRLKSCILASFFLGFLILTKVIFFHVLLVSSVLLLFLFLSKNKSETRWPAFVLIGAALVTMPYIIYAYSVTGKFLYLGTQAGEILYHRSTPFENEWGNWFSYDRVLGTETANEDAINAYQDLGDLRENHRQFYLQLLPLSNMERDSILTAKSIENMKANPSKYVKNTMANVGRFLFNYPYSYRSHNLKAYGYLLPNMFIVVLFILVVYPSVLRRKQIPFEIWALLVFGLIYGGGIIIALGTARYFIVMIPCLALFLGYCYTNVLKITLHIQK